MPTPGSTASRSGALRALYVCYLSLEDPLVETQVVAYLRGLVARGHTIHLLTYEHRRLTRTRRAQLRHSMGAQGLHWHGLRYHKRPSLPATIFDVVCGIAVSGLLVRRHNLQLIHTRMHPSAVVGLAIRWLLGIPFVFDIRGLMAEEYVDAGRWEPGGLPFRVTKWVERTAIDRAAAVVVLTKRVRGVLFGGEPRSHVRVIPCCADIEQIGAQLRRRDELRAQFGLTDRVVLIYVGKFTGWYMEREMVEFFAVAREREDRLFFQVLTQSGPHEVFSHFAELGLPAATYGVQRVPPQQVCQYLAAADAAISFIRPCFSKVSSSPTKIGEYLAAGLPVVSSAGIGDVDELLDSSGTGVLVRDFDRDGYRQAAERLTRLVGDGSVAAAAAWIAEERLSMDGVGIPAYDAMYRSVAEGMRA